MIFATDLHSPEGPVLLPDGDLLVTEMASDRGCVTRISRDGQRRQVIARTGRPNGLALDREGCIWVAESLRPTLLRMTLGGRIEVVADACDGEPFLFPNDLAFGPDGALYLTDSGITLNEWVPNGKLRAGYQSALVDGRVYRIDPKTGSCRKLDTGIRFTNGIAFDALGVLYVNETVTGNVYRYPASGDGEVGKRELFGNISDPDWPGGYRGPDGQKFGQDGNLYVTQYGEGCVVVVGTDGSVVKRIRMGGHRPTNLVFGPVGSRRIYVTEVEHGVVEVHDTDVDGLLLFG
ncbi:MAG: SMP-30/gluconolactonase/LRE family protein [Phycisphaerales bacterium]|nr:SMP-30/gluconolactonase/LRE family protein [Phycisphaerales bacterium]